jgi:asparaginyl-tRNA synthetase
MLEAEVGFITRLDELLDVVENGIRDILKRTIMGGEGKGQRGQRFEQDLAAIREAVQAENGDVGLEPRILETIGNVNQDFKRISYTIAINTLVEQHERKPFKKRPEWGKGLSSEHEKWLAQSMNGPTFVTHYPKALKPFYMLPSTADPLYTEETPGETVACFDLLTHSIGELAGGSLREHRLEELILAMKKAGLKQEEYEWYLDLRRYGSMPHGGWGMGWERWLSWTSGVMNIRDVVAFPRWFGHCKY